jgi:phage gpG-like protein
MSNNVNGIFNQIRNQLERKLSQLPAIVGNEVVNYSLDAFEKQSWEGKAWDKRKSKKDTGRALLVKSARLKRSIRIIRSTLNSVTVGTDVPYARVHNEGERINRQARSETFVRNRYLKGPKSKMFGGMGAFKKGTKEGEGLSFKAYSYNMPQRQFLGNTPALRARIRKVVIEHMNQAA